MILYNITTKVEHGIHAVWLTWMQQAYIPHLMDGGYFRDFKLSRLLGVDETDGITYALQLSLENMTTFRLYQEKLAFQHQSMHDLRYSDKALSFRSVLDVVDAGE